MGELEGFINGSFLFRQNVSGAAVFPSGDYFFLMPWTSTPWRWYYPRKANNNQEKTPWYDAADGTLVNTSHLGNLTLYPAPGEVFRIDVDLADVYFNLVTAACILKVNNVIGNRIVTLQIWKTAKKCTPAWAESYGYYTFSG